MGDVIDLTGEKEEVDQLLSVDPISCFTCDGKEERKRRRGGGLRKRGTEGGYGWMEGGQERIRDGEKQGKGNRK